MLVLVLACVLVGWSAEDLGSGSFKELDILERERACFVCYERNVEVTGDRMVTRSSHTQMLTHC